MDIYAKPKKHHKRKVGSHPPRKTSLQKVEAKRKRQQRERKMTEQEKREKRLRAVALRAMKAKKNPRQAVTQYLLKKSKPKKVKP